MFLCHIETNGFKTWQTLKIVWWIEHLKMCKHWTKTCNKYINKLINLKTYNLFVDYIFNW